MTFTIIYDNILIVMINNEFSLTPDDIRQHAKNIRKKIILMNSHAGQGHTGADLSETDILATLFFNILNINKNELDNPVRDHFILSKGHGAGGFYCTLAEAGYIEESLLDTYLKFDSRLPGHPVKQKIKAVELNTGALGHGVSVGVGLALGAKLSRRNYRVFVLTGDGELQEGSVWEAAMSASQFKLDNLILIIDRNTLQLADKTRKIMSVEPLKDKLDAFGFDTKDIDGHNPAEIIEQTNNLDLSCGKPHALIAHTIKGKGISFIEDKAVWHHKVPVGEQVTEAIEELE